MQSRTKKIIYAISILGGTTIGVGFFALPYITSKIGFWTILLYFLIVGGIALIIHLLFSEIAMETKDYLRLPGYAKIYFGKKGKKIVSIIVIIGALGSMLSYLIVGGDFLSSFLAPILGGSDFLYIFIYFALGTLVMYIGLKIISKIELVGILSFFIVLAAIFFRAQPIMNAKNLFPVPNISYLFLPYGVILFSLWGLDLIPEAEEILGRDKKLLKKIVVPTFLLVSIMVYLFFIFLIVSITGQFTTESAITGLKNVLGNGIVSLVLLFGVTTTFTSFITVGLNLQKILRYDMKIKKSIAWTITCFAPFLLFLFGIRNFINVVSFIGGVILGIEGILIIFMYQKIKKDTLKVKIFTLPLILVFALGIIYQIIYFLK